MPTLHWIGKEKVVSHHQDVPYRVLEHKFGFTADKGEQKEPSNSGNKIIHGDNLEALKSLLPEYEGKIKCIYIDPPYNTGNESWVYNDNVNHPKIKKWLGEVVGKDGEDLTRHDKWLCMMYPRLKLLHKLLADDGVIFISIDDNEQANLKLLCDEIFGVRNFITNVIWEKNYSPRNDAKYFSASHDFLICYTRRKECWDRNLAPRTEKQNRFYKYDDKDGRGRWRPDNVLVKSFSESGVFGIKNPNTDEVHYPPEGSCYRFTEEKAKKMLEDNRFYFGKDGKGKPQMKRYLSEVAQGVVPQTLWKYEEVSHSQGGKKKLNEIISGNVFDSPKPYELIEKVLHISSNKNSIILDSFAGSGTTAHAVLNLNKQDGGNRKFILVEMEDYANDVTAERVKRVAKGYGSGSKKIEGTGGTFDYYELGLPLFDENHNLNEEVGLPKIREYIWFSETRTSFTEPNAENYFLGKKDESVYYFIYEKDRLTTLDYDVLELIKPKANNTLFTQIIVSYQRNLWERKTSFLKKYQGTLQDFRLWKKLKCITSLQQ